MMCKGKEKFNFSNSFEFDEFTLNWVKLEQTCAILSLKIDLIVLYVNDYITIIICESGFVKIYCNVVEIFQKRIKIV